MFTATVVCGCKLLYKYSKVQDLYNRFEKEIMECMEESIPKIEKKKFFAHRHPVWWDDAVKDSKKSLNQAQRKFKVKSTPNNFENLKQAEINFNKVKDLAQEEWGNNLAEKLSKASNVKDKWSVFRKMTKKQNNNMVLPFVDGNGNVTFKEEEKCQQLETTFFKGKHLNPISFDAEFYTEIMDKYHSISEDKEQHLEDDNDIDINFAIEQDELAGAVYRLKNETCPGPDNYFSLLFINGDDNLYSTLLYIMNKSWDEGSLPKSWKQANVKFIKKIGKPNYNNPSSYRPISLTSILGKLMERIVTSRLEGYVESKFILDKEQEGFRHFRSTDNALLTFVQNIFNGFNKDESTIALMIDLEKAYDSIWREGLLTKLHGYGIKGKIWMWIENFLKDREARCNINKHQGQWFKTQIGLPQGSVISPLLFNIFIIDIFAKISSNKCKFADDGTIWKTGKDKHELVKELQKDINSIHEWSTKWRINLSIEKTEFCVFSRNGMTKENIKIMLQGKELKYNPTPKFWALL
ncbi:Hypothetical predicted protein [Mytilus galloprovincialis]|uniref:Reverse transcriptase domain-containing protein n=1 Tax=Mytilus galloprovincialis TaxID=29158 RepID=A0A8B6C8W9_MYTGA|nr:Hypothetical predicted protein [Mytilus galloprovincialis]